MANPIIKIKRGSGVPTSAGITAGEFAFNKTGNILYVGACGGYTGYDTTANPQALGTAVASNDLNIIPIGMQISNDPEMGAGADIDLRAGYSNFTVPTTRAVRDWVNVTKSQQVLGVTFKAGPGIGITADQVGTQTDITISNTGVIKGFTGFSVTGNFHLSSNLVKAKSAIDGITFIGGGGIQLRGTNSQTSLEIQNIGVTSIGGFTGTINSITPIVSLSGFTSGIGLAIRQVVSYDSPIVVADATVNGFNGINITHDTTVTSANLKAYQDGTNIPQLLNLGFNAYGHITSASSAALDFTIGLPIGFTEATQDAAYSGITNFYGNNNYGIDYVYDDGLGLLKTINRGITSLSVSGQVGLSGPVILAVGPGVNNVGAQLSAVQTKTTNTITHEYIGTQYKSFALKNPSVLSYPLSGIYIGGVTGAGPGTLTAASPISTLNVLPGRGIGISMGIQGGSDTMFIWNAGVNTIIARDTIGNPIGDSGFSGNFNIQEGTNVQFARSGNLLTISSSGGGAGGAISALIASYDKTIPPGAYSGSGVTGNVHIIGQNGVITRQETGVDTKDGDVYIGLSSKVKIPALITTADYPEENYQTLEIATRRENGGSPTLPVVGSVDQEYFQTPVEYSKLITDIVEGGFTAAFSYGGGVYAKFSPQLNGSIDAGSPAFNAEKSYPGRILSLRAREGIWKVGDGPAAVISGTHAELRLLGYPNPENMSAYIQGVFDFPSPNNGAGCPNNDCIGMPPILPSCNTGLVEGQEVYYHTDGTGQPNSDSAAEGQQRGTAVFHSNIVAQDSIFVNKDIWLTGELIDATTGCLYAAGAGGGTSVFNGGNLGLTGDLIVDGSIYVHGGTAFFNVADLSTESPLIRIGGLSASNGTEQMGAIGNGQANRFGDRGLLLFSFNPIPYSPLFNANARLAAANITNFIGIDQTDGIFKYIIDATTERTLVAGAYDYTTINTGRLGPARFSEINNVGITSDNTTISLRTGSAGVVTNVELSGHVAITAATGSGNKANILLGNSAKVQLGVVANAGITFNRSIEFDSGQTDTFANSLKIRYQGSGDTQAFRNISIRAPVSGGYTQLVDVGRSPQTDASGAYVGGSDNQGQQTIYNKTLADGTIIDCGTY